MKISRLLVMSATIAGLAGAGAYLSRPAGPAPAQAAVASRPPAMPVPVTTVQKRTLPVYLEYSARAESIRDVALQARVAGYIQDQPAADGADVSEGDLLYKIDDRDYRAALDQARAQAERNIAAREYARANFHRGNELVKTGFLAKDNFDQRASTLGQSEAAVAQDNATIRTAELNLAYTEIRAPFAGRLGRNRAPVGTLAGGSGLTLNTLVQLDPIYVTFTPSERELAAIAAAHSAGEVVTETLLPDDRSVSLPGRLTFVDNSVDRSTGTITARATVPNPRFTLLPGQYVHIRVRLRSEPDALMVPRTAVGASQLGNYVYVVGADGTAEQKLVTLGAADGDLVNAKGVTETDRVITGNLQKIRPGSPVAPLPPT